MGLLLNPPKQFIKSYSILVECEGMLSIFPVNVKLYILNLKELSLQIPHYILGELEDFHNVYHFHAYVAYRKIMKIKEYFLNILKSIKTPLAESFLYPST